MIAYSDVFTKLKNKAHTYIVEAYLHKYIFKGKQETDKHKIQDSGALVREREGLGKEDSSTFVCGSEYIILQAFCYHFMANI